MFYGPEIKLNPSSFSYPRLRFLLVATAHQAPNCRFTINGTHHYQPSDDLIKHLFQGLIYKTEVVYSVQ